jgi:hypothetical protein
MTEPELSDTAGYHPAGLPRSAANSLTTWLSTVNEDGSPADQQRHLRPPPGRRPPSQQRGTNENTNGLLRQYFPKRTDLSIHTAAGLHAVEDRINNRPRKTLGWRTPADVFAASFRVKVRRGDLVA